MQSSTTSLKLLRGFVGTGNYYRDMWPHRSEILAPLTAHTGAPKKGEKQSPFVWTSEMQRAFDQMKALMTADVLCAYPNHNKPFHIYTDAPNYQLVHVWCRMVFLSHTTASSSAVHRWITPQSIRNCFVSLWHYVNSAQCYLALKYTSTQITRTF